MAMTGGLQHSGRMFAVVIMAALALGFGCPASADPPDADDFFPTQSTTALRLSPNGDALAYINTSEIPHRFEVVDLDTMTMQRSASVGVDRLIDIEWATNDRLLLTAIVTTNLRFRGRTIMDGIPVLTMVALDRDAGNATVLLDDEKFSESFHRADLASVLPDDPDHIMMTAGRRGKLRLLKVHIHTGELEEIEKGSSQTVGWKLDRTGRPLVRYDASSSGRWVKIRTRAPGKTKWETFAKVKRDEMESLSPIAQATEPHLWYVSARAPGRDRSSIWIYDFAEKRFVEEVYSHPRVDIHTGQTNNVGEFIGAVYDDGRLSYDFEDNRLDSHLAALGTFFGEEAEVTFESVSRSGSHWLLHVEGPREPGSHFVYDVEKTHAVPIDTVNPHLASKQLGKVESFEYAARDGLSIPAYLTSPAAGMGRLGQAPLIVMPHGGPHLRDSYGFDKMAQYFASRGYAVLQPNFRGSTGYGETFESAGHRQWGRAMQDDLSDGVAHLVAANKARADRVAILGGSYGGYAAMMGLVRDPDLYRCAVSFNGVSDLEKMLKADEKLFGRRSDEYEKLSESIGDRKADREELARFSPARQAARITKPLLLLAGAEDERVLPEQSEFMAEAMRALGKPVTHIVYDGADHSLWGRSQAMRDTNDAEDDDYNYAFKAMLMESERFLADCFAEGD